MLTTHVVSQGLAEELREAGWPQEGSAIYWIKSSDESWGLQSDRTCGGFECDVPIEWIKNGSAVAAPLASELMERIPGGYFAYRRGNSWFTGKDLHQIAVAVASDSMPNALATLWLHLKKEGLLK